MYTLETSIQDAVVLLFLILCLIGLKCVRRPAEAERDGVYLNPGYLSPALCNMWRGIMALTVIIHHVAQIHTGEGILLPRFEFAGQLAVAVFFFLSGYGLQKSDMSKPDYRKRFLLRRLPAVLFPTLIVLVLCWLAVGLLGGGWNPLYVLTGMWKGSAPVSHMWYVLVIIGFYVVFKLLMLLCRRRLAWRIVLACVVYVCWAGLCLVFDLGSWWFNAAHLFVVGIFWAVNEQRLLGLLKKAYWIIAPAVWVLTLALLAGSDLTRDTSTIVRGVFALATTLCFTLTIVLLNMKLTVGNAVLGWLGARSLEIYLVQGIFLYAFRTGPLRVPNHPLYLVLVLVCSAALGAALHPLNRVIRSGWKKVGKG